MRAKLLATSFCAAIVATNFGVRARLAARAAARPRAGRAHERNDTAARWRCALRDAQHNQQA
jgi:hypothetical protein